MFSLMELRNKSGENPPNVPSANDPMWTPMLVNRTVTSDQTQQAPYDPPRPGDYVSRPATHQIFASIAIDPWLAVARWPNLPTINPTRTPRPSMPGGRWGEKTPGRKNIVRRGDQTYGSLSQLYPQIDTVVV